MSHPSSIISKITESNRIKSGVFIVSELYFDYFWIGLNNVLDSTSGSKQLLWDSKAPFSWDNKEQEDSTYDCFAVTPFNSLQWENTHCADDCLVICEIY